jgi:uncharacterized membrane protein YfcA
LESGEGLGALGALVVGAAAFLASWLTFLTGFGLGTLLMPVFALFFPVPVAVAATAVVHLLNNLFKLALVGRRANRGVAARFGIPALAASFAGAAVLLRLSAIPPLGHLTLFGAARPIHPVNLVMAGLMVAFALADLAPRAKSVRLDPRWLPVGGLLSGFFGGISGHQGAFRSVFLLRAGLAKEAFIATGVVIAVAVDLARLLVYGTGMPIAQLAGRASLLAIATGSAFLGAFLGNRHLAKVSHRSIELAVAVLLLAIAVALALGFLDGPRR